MASVENHDDGETTFTISTDERVGALLVQKQFEIQGEINQLSAIPTRGARACAHELIHVSARIGAIALALEEGRLVLTEPTIEHTIARETLDLDLHTTTTEEREYGDRPDQD